MRKKLLRSRSGFEKPESREEAIMQNILGASNVLEPSESNIEEILKSILYNTPYTKEAEFEIEKILLAIKNNGTYDGECESRDLKILFAILNDLDYTEEAESRIEELFIEWLNQRSKIKVLEGVPPLTFVAKGEPLINYEISGNMIQSGTPTPDNPIQPSECGERTTNLCPMIFSHKGVVDDNGGVSIQNTRLWTEMIPVSASSSYYVAINGKASNDEVLRFNRAIQYDASGTFISRINTGANITTTFTTDANCAYIALDIRTMSLNVNLNNTDVNTIQMNAGSTPLPYEPYGIKIPISSASTTTPVYLGEVETTRKIKKLVFDGGDDENWSITNTSKVLYLAVSDFLKEQGTICYCTHYKTVNNVSSADDVNDGECTFNDHINWLYIKDSNYTSAQGFKNYLAAQYANGTPVTVWYVLATETTGIVNEPLMKIGDYADTLSMEQAGVEIPTNNGTTVIDVNTTVKPSNIYIEYK